MYAVSALALLASLLLLQFCSSITEQVQASSIHAANAPPARNARTDTSGSSTASTFSSRRRVGLGSVRQSKPFSSVFGTTLPTAANCTEHYFTQPFDHFSFSTEENDNGQPKTFRQRYLVCSRETWAGPGKGPIFFYVGNEASVEMYVNSNGFMWENAKEFGALLVFAEHRYFGKSRPYPDQAMPSDVSKLTLDQALADFSEIIYGLRRRWGAERSPVIGFGGSYGGMLCTWLRSRYPSSVTGCISGSAPVADFEGMDPSVNFQGFASIETYDASAAGGARSDNCKININKAFSYFYNDVKPDSEDNVFETLQENLNLCSKPKDNSKVLAAFGGAFGSMSMGSYPFPSNYITMEGDLPAYPMRVACDYLSDRVYDDVSNDHDELVALLQAFSQAMHVFYDSNGHVPCINIDEEINEASQIVGYLWGALTCSQLQMVMGTTGKMNDKADMQANTWVTQGDMFFPQPYDAEKSSSQCEEKYQLKPDPLAIAKAFGGYEVAKTASNIFFSNGELDPWASTGILPPGYANASVSTSDAPHFYDFGNGIISAVIRNAGHHLDLFFSHPSDKETSVVAVRELEKRSIWQWIGEFTEGRE